MHLLLPLIAAIVFAIGSMVFKRAFQEGAGVAHATVIINAILGVAFVPLILLHPGPIPWRDALLPILPGAAFVLGHLCNAIALRAGDVSLATPLLGSKVIFVAFLGWLLFGTRLSSAQWGAAALATAGVITMGLTDLKSTRRAGLTTAAALASALCFAGTDTMTQAWAQRIGVWGFLSIQFAAIAGLSVALLPFFGPGALRAPRAAWKWTFVGAAFTAAQAFIIMATIAIWKDAPGVNVVYATRGLWSIALVWHLGHRMKNTERHTTGARTMLQRLVAALLLLGAVVLTLRAQSP